jgi:hypothetical protein
MSTNVQKWRLEFSGPNEEKKRFTNRNCTLREAVEFAAWTCWSDLRYKIGMMKADIIDEKGFLHETVKIESHISE